MSLFTNFSNSSKDSITSIAIGGFDGLHIGHKRLFSFLDENGGILVIENNHMDLTPKRAREKFSKLPFFYLQLDSVVGLAGKEFLFILIEKFPNLTKIVIGYDFQFGNNRESNAKDLQEWFNGEVEIVKEVKANGISVHSRNIRNYIRLSKIKKANELLGREYQIVGEVIKGQGLGMRKLFPTINLSIKNYLLPKEGVYATKTEVNNKVYPSVSFIGHRVSTDGSFAVETHILEEERDFDSNIVSIDFVEKIRDNQYFDNLEELKKQINIDINSARLIFK